MLVLGLILLLLEIGFPVFSTELKSDNPLVYPVEDEDPPRGILICKLGPYQELSLRAFAKKV